MKKAIAALTQVWPDAEVHPFEGMGHGEIVAHPQQMAAEIRRFMVREGALCQPENESPRDVALIPSKSNAFWNRFAFVYDFATRDGDAGLGSSSSRTTPSSSAK